MTEQEQKQWDLKLREIDARISHINTENDKMRAETARINKENNKTLDAEVARIVAETAKINRERWYYPIIVASTATLAIVAFTKIFL